MNLTDKISAYNIDCMEFMKDIPDQHYDLAIVDPPYHKRVQQRDFYGGKVSSTGVSRTKYDDSCSWEVPRDDYFKELLRISTHQIIWGINYYKIQNLGTGRIIWDKCNGNTGYSDAEIAYSSQQDHVRLFPYTWNGMLQGKSIRDGRSIQGNKLLKEKRIHKTQKPVLLYMWLLSKYAQTNDKIFDSHGGSLSLAIACNKTGNSLDVCEKDSVIFEKAIDRFCNETKQIDMFGGVG